MQSHLFTTYAKHEGVFFKKCMRDRLEEYINAVYGWHKCKTDFLDMHCKPVNVYYQVVNDLNVVIVDNGVALKELEACGFSNTGALKKFVSEICESFAIKLDHRGTLYIVAPLTHLAQKISLLANVVSGLCYTLSSIACDKENRLIATVPVLVKGDVLEWIAQKTNSKNLKALFEEWQATKKLPTVRMIRTVALMFDIPFGYFFLKAPLECIDGEKQSE